MGPALTGLWLRLPLVPLAAAEHCARLDDVEGLLRVQRLVVRPAGCGRDGSEPVEKGRVNAAADAWGVLPGRTHSENTPGKVPLCTSRTEAPPTRKPSTSRRRARGSQLTAETDPAQWMDVS